MGPYHCTHCQSPRINRFQEKPQVIFLNVTLVGKHSNSTKVKSTQASTKVLNFKVLALVVLQESSLSFEHGPTLSYLDLN